MRTEHVDLSKFHRIEGQAQIDTRNLGEDVAASIAVRSVDPVAVVAVDHEGEEIPIHIGEIFSRTFHLKGRWLSGIRIMGSDENAVFFADVSVNGTRVREYPDPTPVALAEPRHQSGINAMIQRLVDAEMSRRGLSDKGESSRGYDYASHADDDPSGDDPEFGSGYAVDEQMEQDYEIAREEALREVAKRGKGAVAASPPGDGDDGSDHDDGGSERVRSGSRASVRGRDGERGRMEPRDNESERRQAREPRDDGDEG